MIDLRWTRQIHGVACGLLVIVLFGQLFALTPVMLPWLLGLALVALVLEALLSALRTPEILLSPVLWLSAACTARPVHALFCVGALVILRLWSKGVTSRVVAAVLALGLLVLIATVPEALFSSWSATEVAHAAWLYRLVAIVTATPLIAFCMSRPEDPSCSPP